MSKKRHSLFIWRTSEEVFDVPNLMVQEQTAFVLGSFDSVDRVSIYFFFVNTYLAAVFLSLFVGYVSANIINVYASHVKEKDDTKVPSR